MCPYGSPAEDLLIENGRFTQRRPASTTELLATDIDGQNQLLTPALVESHVHLDKPSGASRGAPTALARPSRITSPTNGGSCVKSKPPSRSEPVPCWKTASPVAP
jgi:hypothetical protein